MAPWLFLILIVSASYTATLTTMLTNSRLEPPTLDVRMLKKTNAVIGCDGNSVIVSYLAKVLGFKPENIIRITSIDDFAEALSSTRIGAAFLLAPHSKIFFAKFCKGFTTTGPTYQLEGFRFVFPKGSSLALDISVSIQRLIESGGVQKLEEEMLSTASLSCSAAADTSDNLSLGTAPFSGLFILSGGVSLVSLLLAALLRSRSLITDYIKQKFRNWAATLDQRLRVSSPPLYQWNDP